MNDIAIRVENLSKQYKIGAAKQRYDTLRDQLTDGFKGLFRRNGQGPAIVGPQSSVRDTDNTIWALKDISFEVKQGEVLGIIGRNGAGKSTLLKILSRITEPTLGRAEIFGRVASLLEVGTGFHLELTGRENVYLNGAVLGMNNAEINRKFDEIVAFSGIEQFIDTPLKRYSSGMKVRLAFSVAAHLEPEILIIDEVLAVGDTAFQKKCLGKIGEVAGSGRTVLFVSHSMLAVASFCQKAIWLEAGSIKQEGGTREVIQNYLDESSNQMRSKLDVSSQSRTGRIGQELRIVGLEWLTKLPASHSEEVKVRFHLESAATFEGISVTLGFSTLEGTRLLSYDSDAAGDRQIIRKGQTLSVDLKIEEFPLPPGKYFVDLGSRSGDTFTLDYLPAVAKIEVSVGRLTPGYIQMGTGVRLPATWLWCDREPVRAINGIGNLSVG